MAKKPAKTPAKPAAKASAKSDKPKTKAAASAKATAKVEAAKTEDAPKKPVVPPKPVPAHQQFLSQGGHHGGPRNQHMAKGRIFRHQGR